jgi:hypothetical protein
VKAVRAELRALDERKPGIKDSALAAGAIAVAKRIDDPDTTAAAAASCLRALERALGTCTRRPPSRRPRRRRTNLSDGARSELLGAQRPSVFWTPPAAVSSAIEDAREVAETANIELDDWQDFTLEHGLGEREDGQWASFEVGVDLSRQNGKGGVLEVRELTGIFVLGERTVTHSAHEMGTSLEAQERMLEILEGAPDLEREIQRVSKTNGKEAIYFKGGRKIRYRTRTKSGGRGLGGDLLVIDEDMIVRLAMMGALMPILSARPNPQIWYMGSPVDQTIHEHGLVKAKLRARALAALAGDPRPATRSPGSSSRRSPTPSSSRRRSTPARTPRTRRPRSSARCNATSRETRPTGRARTPPWASASPTDYIRNEQRSLDPRSFAVERLGVGDWPAVDLDGDSGWKEISKEDWQACENRRPKRPARSRSPSPYRSTASGRRSPPPAQAADGRRHLEVIDHRAGTQLGRRSRRAAAQALQRRRLRRPQRARRRAGG